MSDWLGLPVNIVGGVLLLVGIEETFVSFGVVSTAGYGAVVAVAVAGLGLGLLRYRGRPRHPK